jgi:hypothetical protein
MPLQKTLRTQKIEEERNLLLANLTQINKELIVLSHKTSRFKITY